VKAKCLLALTDSKMPREMFVSFLATHLKAVLLTMSAPLDMLANHPCGSAQTATLASIEET